MEPQFPHTPEGFAAQQIYLTFREHMLHIGCFLPLSSVINFTALSRYFNNALNNPTSDYGRVFWRTWSVKTGNMKAFSTSSINYKFKLVKQKICDMKKVIKSCNLHAWRKSYCKNCNKICQPDRYDDWLFNDRYGQYCNCQTTNCETKIELIKKDLVFKKRELKDRKALLQKKMDHIDRQMSKLNKKAKEIKELPSWEPLVGVLQNIGENAHYKSTRTQATKLLKEVKELVKRDSNIRTNINYKAPLGMPDHHA